MQQPTLSRKIRGYLLFTGLYWLGIGLALLMMRDSMAHDIQDLRSVNLVLMPITPLSQLKQFAGKNQVVRVKARLAGPSEMTDGAGHPVAFKAAVQTYTPSRSPTRTEDWWWNPPIFEIGSGKNTVTVDSTHHMPDVRFLDKKAHVHLSSKSLPPEIVPLVTPDFPKLEPIADDDLTVYTLDAGATVTVYGVVALQNGQVVLKPSQEKYLGKEVGRLIVSGNETKLKHELNTNVGLSIFLIVALAIPYLIIMGALLIDGRKKSLKQPLEEDAWSA